jgi:DNA-binding transcriptional ArsR family regulator
MNEARFASVIATSTRIGYGKVMHRAKAHTDVFRAIADPTRRAILDRLRAGPAAVNALADDFKQTRPAVSKHLRVLRLARLVSEERVGRERLYQLRPAPLQQIAGWIEGYRAFWVMNLDRLKRFVEEDK